MSEFSLVLALQNFLPVLLSTSAMLLLARMVALQDARFATLAGSGAVLVGVGGILKASWKLVIVLGGPDLWWLSQALFPLVGPGFLFLAWALLLRGRFRHTPQTNRLAWAVPLLIVAVVDAAAFASAQLQGGRSWFFLLLMLLTLANLLLSGLLIVQALRAGCWFAALLFGLNLASSFVLAALANVQQRDAAYYWLEQGISTLAALGFLAASATLLRRTRDARLRAAPALQPLHVRV